MSIEFLWRQNILNDTSRCYNVDMKDRVFKKPRAMLYLIATVKNLFAFLELLIISRIILDFLRASGEALFTQWVHAVTNPLLTPFVGIFPAVEVSNGFLLEFHAISALIVYAIVGYLISSGFGVLAVHMSHLRREKSKL